MGQKRREEAPAGLIDLANERLGGAALLCTDDFFAPMENLVRDADPVWKEGVYTERGKWMDGWESRRKRVEGHDWCIVRLGLPGVIKQVVVDTAFFRGNFPESCSLEAVSLPGAPSLAALQEAQWEEILPVSILQGHHRNVFAITDPRRFTHLRLHIHPDGGVARLRVYGEALMSPDAVRGGDVLDLAAVEHGGRGLGCSDAFFGAVSNMLMPGRGVNMGDGWETRRRRGPGHDWAVVKLAGEGDVERVVVDTWHFKGNYPGSCEVHGAHLPDGWSEDAEVAWAPLVERVDLQAHTAHPFAARADAGPVTHVRLKIHPDGGVSRFRVFGRLTSKARAEALLRHFNCLGQAEAVAALRDCCASQQWAQSVAEARPFESLEAVKAASDKAWEATEEADWRQAFDGHPRIGERKAAGGQSAAAKKWSGNEQSGVDAAQDTVKAALAQGNVDYEAKFGFIFLICATGKSAQEMLDALKGRLDNDPQDELRVAAAEQHKITTLRLEKMFT